MDSVAPILVATAGVAAFAFVLARSAVVPVSKTLLETVASGVTSMLDSNLDDAAKERAVRAAGFALLAGAWKLGWRFVVALAAVAIPIALADAVGLVAREQSFGVLMRVDFIAAVSVLAVLSLWIFGRRADSPLTARRG